jgi:hypothetical protein
MTEPSATGLGSLRPRPKPQDANPFLFDPTTSDRADDGNNYHHQQNQDPELALGPRYSGHARTQDAAGVAEGYMASPSLSPQVTSHSNPPSQRSSVAGGASRLSNMAALLPGVMWEEGGGATGDGSMMGPASGEATVL